MRTAFAAMLITIGLPLCAVVGCRLSEESPGITQSPPEVPADHPPATPEATKTQTLLLRDNWTFFIAQDTPRNAVPPVVALCDDFGGAVKVTVRGAPSAFTASQKTRADVRVGDTVVFTLAHSNLGNFSNSSIGPEAADWPGGNGKGYGDWGATIWYANGESRSREPVNAPYTAKWVADRDYPTDSVIIWHGAAWPGAADHYFIKAEVVHR